jgi:steroid 5-alpha reductase family enzyme
MSILTLILLGWLAAACLMGLLWLVQLWTGDAGSVDVAWAAGVGLLSAAFAWLSPAGLSERKWLVLAVVLVWAIRLAGYVLMRVLTMPEDGRYTALKEMWGPQAAWRMFRFYQLQAVGVVLFALPILIALRNPQPLFWLDWLGLTIGVFSIAGESLADWQLSRFRSQAANRGQVCNHGLRLLCHQQLALGLLDPARSADDVVPDHSGHRDSADGSPVTEKSWRSLSSLSTNNKSLFPLVSSHSAKSKLNRIGSTTNH